MIDVKIDRDVRIGGEDFPLVVQTFHGDAEATTAIHGVGFDRHIGGVRFVPEAVTGPSGTQGLAEVAHLASAMTPKCAAASIPASGQKTVVRANRRVLGSAERKAQILIEHAYAVIAECPGAIFGPDMNNPEAVQARAASADGLLDHFTGLTPELRGLSIDANGFTAHGLDQAIDTCMGAGQLKGKRVTIQGAGAVGMHAAQLLHAGGAHIVGMSDISSLVTGHRIDVPVLFASWKMRGDVGLRAHAATIDAAVSAEPNRLLGVATDIFVPAARTAILATAEELSDIKAHENPDVQDVADFLSASGVQIVVEGANYPLTPAAERFLEQLGVRILPDYIVNIGGLVGCWMEWEVRHARGLDADIDLDQIAAVALARIRKTVADNVRELIASGLPARESAVQIVKRNRSALLSGAAR